MKDLAIGAMLLSVVACREHTSKYKREMDATEKRRALGALTDATLSL